MVWSAYRSLNLPDFASEKEIQRVQETVDVRQELAKLCQRLSAGELTPDQFKLGFLPVLLRGYALTILTNHDQLQAHHDALTTIIDRQESGKKGLKKSDSAKKTESSELELLKKEHSRKLLLKSIEHRQRDKWLEYEKIRDLVVENQADNLAEEALLEYTVSEIPEFIDEAQAIVGFITGSFFADFNWLNRRTETPLLLKPFQWDTATNHNQPQASSQKKSKKQTIAPHEVEQLRYELMLRALGCGELALCKELVTLKEITRVAEWQKIKASMPDSAEIAADIGPRVKTLLENPELGNLALLDILGWNACRIGKFSVARMAWESLGLNRAYCFLLRDFAYQSASTGFYDQAARALIAASDIETNLGPLFSERGPLLHLDCQGSGKPCFTLEAQRIDLIALPYLLGSDQWRERFEHYPAPLVSELLKAVNHHRDPTFREFYQVFRKTAATQRTLIEQSFSENRMPSTFPKELLAFPRELVPEYAELLERLFPEKDSEPDPEETGEESLLDAQEERETRKELEISIYQILSSLAATHPLSMMLVCFSNYAGHQFLVPTRQDPGFTPESVDQSVAT